MRLLFDENLPPSLVHDLASMYPGSVHVSDVGLQSAPDQDIWQYAGSNGFLIVTKDDDFRQRSFLFGAPPKVIWLRLGNCRRHELADALIQHHGQVREFVSDEQSALLVIARSARAIG